MQFRIFAGLVLAALIIYTFIEPYLLQIKEDTIYSEKIPEGISGLKIGFMSDIHCGLMLSPQYQSQSIKLLNSQKPDIIFLGGDYTYSSGENLEKCLGGLSELQAPYGVYAVSGNHDNWESSLKTRLELEKAKIKLIDNSGFWFQKDGGRIRFGGVGDLWTQTQNLESAVGDAENKDYKILLSHNPRYMEKIQDGKIDLMLSGHTHGGQIFPLRIIAPYLGGRMKQIHVSGRYEVGKTTVIVSNGVGAVFTPQRFLTRPQINVITLMKK